MSEESSSSHGNRARGVRGGAGDWRQRIQSGSSALSMNFEAREVLQPQTRLLSVPSANAPPSSMHITPISSSLSSSASATSSSSSSSSKPTTRSSLSLHAPQVASNGRFWRPGTLAPGVEIERDDSAGWSGDAAAAGGEAAAEGGGGPASAGGLMIHNANEHLSIRQQRLVLPVYMSRREILFALEKYQVVVIMGETGSGKTTQIPQYLHEAGWTVGCRMVACTQPRWGAYAVRVLLFPPFFFLFPFRPRALCTRHTFCMVFFLSLFCFGCSLLFPWGITFFLSSFGFLFFN